MHNPTKVFNYKINNNNFTMYELPGYNNQVISKLKNKDSIIPPVPNLSPNTFLTQQSPTSTIKSGY